MNLKMVTVKVKVRDAPRRQLDWIVAGLQAIPLQRPDPDALYLSTAHLGKVYSPASIWDAHSGAIIEYWGISLNYLGVGAGWHATANQGKVKTYAAAPLVAAMRAYILLAIGETARIPRELQ